MASRPWWTHLIQWAVWLALMALVMGWLARARLKPRAADDRDTLEHPIATLVTGLGSTAFFLTLTILSARASGPSRSSWAPFLFLALALLGAWLIVAFCRERLQLEPGGLRYRRALGRSGVVRWSEVAAVSYSPAWKWFRIATTDGRAVRASAMLRGLPELAQALLAEVRPPAIDGETRSILERTAAGSPPSVWS
jgi:hypothetical protein